MYLANVGGATYTGGGVRPPPTGAPERFTRDVTQPTDTYLSTKQTQQTPTPETDRYARFGDISQYRSNLTPTTPGATQEMFNIPTNAPLEGLNGLLVSNPFRAWSTGDGGFDEAQFMTYNSAGGVPLYRKNEAGQWEINPEGRLGELNSQFKGLDFRLENDPYTEDYQDGRPSFQLKWNPEALPQDRFGNYGVGVGVEGYEDGRLGTLRYPDAVYDDPFYGRITDPRNLQQHQDWFDEFNRMLVSTPMLVSLAAGGLGGALGGAGLLAGGLSPSNALLGGQIASGLARGASLESFIPMLISAGFSLSGANELLGKLAPLVRSGINYGVGRWGRDGD